MKDTATISITDLYDSEGVKLDPEKYQWLIGETYELLDGETVTNGYLQVVE